MAIQPPSDILLDVAGAADPAKVREATARLAKLAADPVAADASFGKALAAATKAGASAAGGGSGVAATADMSKAAPAPTTPGTDVATLKRAPTAKLDVYRKFEAVLLQNFVEAMLPKDDDLYGSKESSGAYRSMMAEQLAGQIAKAGGVGIAKAVEHAHPAHAAPPRDAQPLAKA